VNPLQALQEKIACDGLHNVVAARLRNEGFKVAALDNLADAARVLGTKMHEKNAAHRRVVNGLAALRELERSR